MNKVLKHIAMVAITMWLCSPSFCSGQSEQESGRPNSPTTEVIFQSEASASPSISELIDRTKDWPSINPNPIALIRASNMLRKLPKSEILKHLSEYNEKYTSDPKPDHKPYHLHALIELLFDPADPNQRLEYPSSIVTSYPIAKDRFFPLLPRVLLKLSDDIPWAMEPDYFAMPPLSEPDIQWLKQYAVVKKEPLRPADNPLVTAESLMQVLIAAEHSMDHSNAHWAMDRRILHLRKNISKQSISMVSTWIPAIPELPDEDFLWQPVWAPLLKKSQEIGLYWDETKQEYAIERHMAP